MASRARGSSRIGLTIVLLVSLGACAAGGARHTDTATAGSTPGSSDSESAASSTVAVTPGPNAVAPPSDFPVGTYETTRTEEDYARYGVSGEGMLRENTGAFAMTLGADGRWTNVMESLEGHDLVAPLFHGRYYVDGPRIEFHVDFPPHEAGAIDRLRWLRIGDTLRFMPDGEMHAIVEAVYSARPWLASD